jgi:hypothetical protein
MGSGHLTAGWLAMATISLAVRSGHGPSAVTMLGLDTTVTVVRSALAAGQVGCPPS